MHNNLKTPLGIGCICFALISGAFAMTQETSFAITSDDFAANSMLSMAQVYNAHGCSGQNISPQLSWSNPPADTKSFALICHDPDAPLENGWYHWLVVNIPASTTTIQPGTKVAGALETINDFKQASYGGPCPPIGHGVHHYNFTLYALDTPSLDIDPQTPPTEVEALVKEHAVAQTTITGLYERK